MFVLAVSPLVAAQSQSAVNAEPKSVVGERTVNSLFNYLNMAGTEKANEFQPRTQRQRTQIYLKTMINPFGYIKVGFSAGIDQWNDKPEEWGQGASAYGKRYANILGQYSIQRTVTFGLSSLLHEDNRYFNSDKSSFWPRTKYALESGILARHDDGRRHISISQLGGVAAGVSLANVAASEPELSRRRSRQLRYHDGQQYRIRSGEGVSSRPRTSRCQQTKEKLQCWLGRNASRYPNQVMRVADVWEQQRFLCLSESGEHPCSVRPILVPRLPRN